MFSLKLLRRRIALATTILTIASATLVFTTNIGAGVCLNASGKTRSTCSKLLTWLGGGDQYRLDRTVTELNQLQINLLQSHLR